MQNVHSEFVFLYRLAWCKGEESLLSKSSILFLFGGLLFPNFIPLFIQFIPQMLHFGWIKLSAEVFLYNLPVNQLASHA